MTKRLASIIAMFIAVLTSQLACASKPECMLGVGFGLRTYERPVAEVYWQDFWSHHSLILVGANHGTTAFVLDNTTGATIVTSRRVVGSASEAIQRFNVIAGEEHVSIDGPERAAEYAALFLSAHLPELVGGWLPDASIASIVFERNTRRYHFLISNDYNDAGVDETYAREKDWSATCDVFDQVSRPVANVVSEVDGNYVATAYRSDCSQVDRFEVTISREGHVKYVDVQGNVSMSQDDTPTRE